MLRKKISILLLSLLMFSAQFPTSYASSASNSCGDGLTWSFNQSTGTLTISGDGELDYFMYQDTPWYSVREKIKSIVFDGEITGLGNYAFLNCTALESVTIPATVADIGYLTFENCTNLTSANILSSSLWSFDGSIFNGCDKLTDITFSDNCEDYKSVDGIVYTKDGDTLVAYPPGRQNTKFDIPENVHSIGIDTFRNHHFIQEINIPKNVSDITEGFVCSCPKLATITVNSNNKYYTAADNVLFTKDMKTLLCYAEAKTGTFYKIPDGVERVGAYAFYDTNITEFQLPAGLYSVGSYAFSYGAWWYNNYSSTNGTYLNDILLEIPWDAQSFTVRSGTRVIADGACEWRSEMTSIVLPDSLKYIGKESFCGCEELTSLNLSNAIVSIDDGAFRDSGLTSISLPDSLQFIGNEVFDYTPMLENSSSWTDNVLYSGKFLISAGQELTGNYTVKNNTRYILSGAFKEASSVESVTLPDSVEFIGDNPFSYHASKFKNIPKNIKYIGDRAYYGAEIVVTGGNAVFPEGLTYIGEEAFERSNGMKSITLPSTLEKVGNSAFKLLGYVVENGISAESLKITNPDTVYGNSVFHSSGLSSVIFPDGMKRIEDSLFDSRCSFSSVYIPKSIEYIGNMYFENSAAVYYPGTETEWNQIEIAAENNFNRVNVYCNFAQSGSCGDDAEWSLDVGTGTLTITGTGATSDYFQDATTLSPWNSFSNLFDTVVIKSGIGSLGKSLFKNCLNLKKVYIPASVQTIDCECFDGCYSLNEVHAESLRSWLNIYFARKWNGTSMYNGSYTYNAGPLQYGADFYIGDKLVKNLVIPSQIYRINAQSFKGCKSIESVTFCSDLAQIDELAFSECDNLSNVCFIGNATEWNEIDIDETNTELLSAALTYISGTITKISISGKSFTIKPVNISNGNTVLLALYNGGKLVDVQSAKYAGSDIQFPTDTVYTSAKVMVWSGLDSLIPVCNAEIVK